MSAPKNPSFILIYPERPTRKNSENEQGGSTRNVIISAAQAQPVILKAPFRISERVPFSKPRRSSAQVDLHPLLEQFQNQEHQSMETARRVDAMNNYLSSRESSRPDTPIHFQEQTTKVPKVQRKNAPSPKVVKAPPRPEWNGYINFVPPQNVPKLRSDRSREERAAIAVTIRRPRKFVSPQPFVRKVPILIPPHLKYGTGFEKKGKVVPARPSAPIPSRPQTPVPIESPYDSSNFSSTATSQFSAETLSITTISSLISSSLEETESSVSGGSSFEFSPRCSLIYRMS